MRKFKSLLTVLLLWPLLGTAGFMVVENLRFLDALYMAIITLSTIGYEVVKPLSDEGKVFVIIYITVGFSAFFYALTKLGEMAVGGELKRVLEGRIMDRQIKGLSDHYIICGFGRMGRAIAQSLAENRHEFVIVEKDQERIELAMQANWRCIEGDGTDDEVLKTAGMEKCRCIAVVLPHDADNLYTVMSARLLNKEATIITRASSESAVIKLKRAGANRVVNPYATGAIKIAQLMINPNLEDFIGLFGKHQLDVELTVTNIEHGSFLVGQTLRDLRLPDHGMVVIGHKRKGQELQLPPPLDLKMEANDSLMIVGKAKLINSVLGLTRSI